MPRKKSITQIDPTVVSEVFTRRVAILAIAGNSAKQIGEQLGFAEGAIEAIQKGEQYKNLVTVIGEQEMTFAVAKLKSRLSNMTDKAAKVYEKVMDDYLVDGKGARDAVVVAQSVTRAVGADKSEDRPQDGNLTIILPPGAQPTSEPITVTAERIDDDTA